MSGLQITKKKGVVVNVFNFFFFKFLKFQIFEKLKEEIFTYTILCNRFVRYWYLFCVRNSYYVKNLIAIQIQSCIKLECCGHTCPNCSGFNFCGRIKLCPTEHLVAISFRQWYKWWTTTINQSNWPRYISKASGTRSIMIDWIFIWNDLTNVFPSSDAV